MKLFKYIWAAPVSVLGLLLALLLRGRAPRWIGGVLEFHVDRIFRGFRALTLGWVTLYRERPGPRLRRHEYAHVKQCFRLGPLVLIAYPLASLLAWLAGGYAYEDNVFEIMARKEASC